MVHSDENRWNHANCYLGKADQCSSFAYQDFSVKKKNNSVVSQILIFISRITSFSEINGFLELVLYILDMLALVFRKHSFY